MTDISRAFEYFVGESMNAVHFVMDYVELHFNGSYLRCLVSPVVLREGRSTRFPDPGSRDALCALIEDAVASVRVIEGDECRVVFDSGAVLTVALTDEACGGREALHFQRNGAETFGVL